VTSTTETPGPYSSDWKNWASSAVSDWTLQDLRERAPERLAVGPKQRKDHYCRPVTTGLPEGVGRTGDRPQHVVSGPVLVAVATGDPDAQRTGSDGLVAAPVRQGEPGTATTTAGGRSRVLPTHCGQIPTAAADMHLQTTGGRKRRGSHVAVPSSRAGTRVLQHARSPAPHARPDLVSRGRSHTISLDGNGFPVWEGGGACTLHAPCPEQLLQSDLQQRRVPWS